MGRQHFELAGRQFPATTWYKDPALRKTYIILMYVALTSATNGYNGSMMNGLQTLTPWRDYFGHPTGSRIGILNAIMSIGSVAAILFVPYAADVLGRRVGIPIGCVIMMIGVVLQSISAGFGMFLSARFLLGFGVAIAHGASALLVTELAHPQHRAVFTTIYNTTWYAGSIIAAWLTFGTLIAHDQQDKALQILGAVHANGDTTDEVVQLEYVEIRDTLRLEKELHKTGWAELVRTKGNRHRLVIQLTASLFSQWSDNGLVSYYITKVLADIGYTDSVTQNLINGVLQVFNFAVALTMCFFVDRVGRRRLFPVSTAGILATFVVWTVRSARYGIAGSKAAANGVAAMIYMYYFCYNLAWSGLLVGYCVEILPYNIRAKGLTVTLLMVDVARFFNRYVNPIALDGIGWKSYIFYCVWLGVELATVYFFYVETRNTPLEEIAKHFDGDQAVVAGVAATDKGIWLAGEMGMDATVTQKRENEEKGGGLVAGVSYLEETIGMEKK